jgi:hypothetical protein
MSTATDSGPLPTGSSLGVVLVVAGVVSLVTLGIAFTLLALGVPFFWVAFPVGFGGVLPVAVGVAMLATGSN